MENIQPDSVLKGRTLAFHGLRSISLVLLYVLFSLLLSACSSGLNLLGGGEWQASSLASQHIRALAVDSTNAQELYAGNDSGALFVSLDGGLHWTQRSQVSTSPLDIQELATAPSGKNLYALTDAGLFVSTNEAQTWQLASTASSGLPSDSYITMTSDQQKTLFVGTHSHGVYSSSDGVHWHSLTGTLPSAAIINELVFDSTQKQLWAATSLGVFRTANNGQTWSAFDSGLPSGNVTSLQVAAIFGGTPGLVYAGTDHGIYRSMDNGAHWSTSGQILNGVLIYTMLIDFRSTNASTIYVGTPFGIFRSDDDGQNWAGVAANSPKQVPVYTLVIGGTSASQLYAVANNIYLYPGTDTGLNPTRVVSLLLIGLLFFLLFLTAQRSWRRRAPFPKRTVAES